MLRFVSRSPFYLFLFLLTFIILMAYAFPGYSATIDTKAKQAVLLDYETGDILFQKNAHERMPTSSMSKVMTMYQVFEALRDGSLSLDDELPVSEKAWRKGGSKMFVEVGKTVKVEDLIRGVIVQSGNDATIVLAEHLAGTEDLFADMLNRKAEQLGMENSHFANASGWPDPNHYSTAYDLAVMARSLIQEFPEYYSYYSEKEFTYNDIKQPNRNPLLYVSGLGADGIKTGHTEAAGYGLIGSGEQKGRRVVMVVNGLNSNRERADEGKRLLAWGLHGFENMNLLSQGEVISEAKVLFGKYAYVDMAVKEPVRVSINRDDLKGIKASIEYEHPLEAPIQKGQPVGRMVLEIPDREKQVVSLVAASDIPRVGMFQETLIKAGILFAKPDEQTPEQKTQ